MRLSLIARASALAEHQLKLYQFKICPFCNKTKAALDFLRVPYASIEVDPLTRSQIKFSKDHKKVPIAKFDDGAIVGGSTEIVDRAIAGRELPRGADTAHLMSADALFWTKWCDEKFAVTVYPNITRSVGECWRSLGYLHDEFSPPRALFTRTLGALGMAMAHGKIKKKYGMDDERQALDEVVATWTAAVGAGPFRGGSSPDLSDLAVFGCLRGLQHLPIYEELQSRPNFGPWLERMSAAVEAGPSVA